MIVDLENPRIPKPDVGIEEFLDLFCGLGGSGGGITEAYELSGKRCRGTFVNHWDKAINMHAANHAEHRHIITSVEEISYGKLFEPSQRLSLLWGSPSCFVAGTLVATATGLKPIELVRAGEYVLTHKNRWRRVTRTYASKKETWMVSGYGHHGLETTAEHPFYSKRVTRRYPTVKTPNGKRRRPGVIRELVENPFWPKASQLKGQLWATPLRADSLPIPPVAGGGISFSDDFFRFLGLWLGDGYTAKDGEIILSLGTHEEAVFTAWFDAHPLRDNAGNVIKYWKQPKGSTVLFCFSSVGLHDWLRDQFGTNCYNKNIPGWVLGLQHSWKQSIVDGYRETDGHDGESRITTTSVSKALTLGIKMLVTALGHPCSFVHIPARMTNIEGRNVQCQPQFGAAWTRNLQRKTFRKDSQHMFTSVQESAATGVVKDVYNLEVQEDESYVADGIVVHNCTFFSVARGGKPVDDQGRAGAWSLVRWARHGKPLTILVENVKEFRYWGPLMQKRDKKSGRKVWIRTYLVGKKKIKKEVTSVPFKQAKHEARYTWLRRLSEAGFEMALVPDPKRKGEYFNAWYRAMLREGYVGDHKIICSADYGDPTIRRRLFIQFARIGSGRRIVWPNPTHGKPDKNGIVSPLGRKPWRTAREIIDWSDLGKSIFERDRPLAKKTIERIVLGLVKYGLKDFIVPKDRGYDGKAVKSVDEPLSVVTTTHRGEMIVRPYLVQNQGESTAQSPDAPLGAVLGGPKHHVVNPEAFILPHPRVKGDGPVTTDTPLGTVTATSSDMSVVSPFLVQTNGTSDAKSVDEPINTVLGKQKMGVLNLEAYHVPREGIMRGNQPAPLSEPLKTVVASHGAGHVAFPYMVKLKGTGRANDVDDPLGTVCGALHHAITEAYLMVTDQTGSNGDMTYSQNDPVRTAVSKQNQAVISPSLNVPANGTLEPYLVDTAHGDGTELNGSQRRVRDLLEPLLTICGNRGSLALIRPWIYTYYSSGAPGGDIDHPLPVTGTRDGAAICYPALEWDGKIYVLDIRYRMLQPRELARAQGFPDSYKLVGTKTDQVKGIGNSVSHGVARALALASLNQTEDITPFLAQLEEA